MNQTDRASYVLGDTSEEHHRLILQSRFIGELTETLFARAGLGEGMDVLDIGCGVGDVSILAAALVGAKGKVLGVDRSDDAIALARQRIDGAGLGNIEFEVGTLDDLEGRLGARRFDALVGRLILIYLQDPAGTIGKLAKFVRPGGLVIFQEMEMATSRAVPAIPLYESCGRWIVTAFQRAGIEINMGSRLPAIYEQAGLPQPRMIGGARVEAGAQSEVYEWVAQTVRSLLPVIEKTGVATSEEIGIDTLASRLRDEVLAAEAVIYSPLYVGAWARKTS